MRLTQRNWTALLALRELAKSPIRKRVSLTDLAARLTVSKSYLEQIFARLRHDGMVRGTRGTGGGYILAQPLTDISLVAVLLASDSSAPARPSSACADLRADLDKRLRHVLGNITLADLYETLSQGERRVHGEPDQVVRATATTTTGDAAPNVAATTPTSRKLIAA